MNTGTSLGHSLANREAIRKQVHYPEERQSHGDAAS